MLVIKSFPDKISQLLQLSNSMTKTTNQKNQLLTFDGVIREGFYQGDDIWAETWITRWNQVGEDVGRGFLAEGGMIVKVLRRRWAWQVPQHCSLWWDQCLHSICRDYNVWAQKWDIWRHWEETVFGSFWLRFRPLGKVK